ncbi:MULTISPECIES: hypothetical protein [Mycetohabitans]|uniref:Uncharacterized protein n=1 Tax=Mycetohabitans rhizoxinica TaxID=412963 RepID=A0ABZ2PUJ0_9BURK|nr:hypothetical protein [Mycetohabitans sp. B2]MCF7696522.1 hypothetical protein [Mycetohabitans sp. B2]
MRHGGGWAEQRTGGRISLASTIAAQNVRLKSNIIHLSRQHGRDLEGEAVSAPLGLAMRHGTWSAALLLASATHAQPNCTDAVKQMCLDALTVARMKRLNGYLHCQLKSRLSQP